MCLEGENSECFTLLLENVSLSSIFWGWELLSASCEFLFENISVHMSEGESVSKLIHVQFSWGWEIPSVSRTTYFQFFWGREILSVSRKAIFIFSEGRDSECFEKNHVHFSWGWEILSVSRIFIFLEGERFCGFLEQFMFLRVRDVWLFRQQFLFHVSWGWEIRVSTTIPFSFFLRVRDSECIENN